MGRLMLAAAAALASAPAIAAPPPAPVAWFKEPPQDVSNLLANICVNRSALVVEQDGYHVLCSRQVSGLSGIFAQALIGNSYSTTPDLKVRFAIMKDGDLTRVQASQWIETQMAFGQVRRQELTGRKQNDSLQGALLEAGGHAVRPTDLPPIEPPSGN